MNRLAALLTVSLTLLTLGSASAELQLRWAADIGALSGAASRPGGGGGAAVLGQKAIYQLDSAGAVRWAVPMSDIGRAFPVWRADGSLLAASYDDFVYAVSAEGKVLWLLRLDGDIYASPALLPDGSAVVALSLIHI